MTVPTLARLHQISVAIFLEEMGVLELTPVQYGILMVGSSSKAFLEMMRRIVSESNHLGRAHLRLDRRTDQIGPNDASSPLC